jgi:hypothetical protein
MTPTPYSVENIRDAIQIVGQTVKVGRIDPPSGTATVSYWQSDFRAWGETPPMAYWDAQQERRRRIARRALAVLTAATDNLYRVLPTDTGDATDMVLSALSRPPVPLYGVDS